MLLEEVLDFGHELPLLQKPQTCAGLASEHQVGADGQRFDQAEVLVDDRDARVAGFRRGIERNLFAVYLDGAPVIGVDSTENLDQRRLPGAVLAKEGMHLAGENVQV